MTVWEGLLEQSVQLGRQSAWSGTVANYIPEIAAADPSKVGIAMVTPDGQMHQAGDAEEPFTLQSISKVLSLMLALIEAGPDVVFSHVGVEPTGDPYNSIIRLETGPDKPLNPFINAGSIAVADLIPGSNLDDRVERLLHFVRKLAGNDQIRVNEAVARSEWATGHRNRALAYFLKDSGHLSRSVEETLRLYCAQCAIELSCGNLAQIAAKLAYPDGSIPMDVIHTAIALMITCGLYDGSGRFAVQVGIPAKSGVAGGIMAVTPGRAAIATYGPALDDRGNSIAGVTMLANLSAHARLSIFLPSDQVAQCFSRGEETRPRSAGYFG